LGKYRTRMKGLPTIRHDERTIAKKQIRGTHGFGSRVKATYQKMSKHRESDGRNLVKIPFGRKNARYGA